MSLPVRISIEDIQPVCSYLATKPTGSTLKDLKSVVDRRHLDARKLAVLKEWELIEEVEGRLKITALGRDYIKNDAGRASVLSGILRRTPPYLAIIERAAHRHDDTLTTTDVAAHWHEHFRNDVGGTDLMLNYQAVVFLQVASGAGLGTLIMGRKGQLTRFSFNAEALAAFVEGYATDQFEAAPETELPTDREGEATELSAASELPTDATPPVLGQGIFIAHGKNKKPLEQLEKILGQFRIPYKVAVEEPNLGRPISGKVRDIMKSCNCAILIFSADEEFRDKDGNTIWRPSENVVYELGATAYLYDNRIVIMKEEGVNFPANFRDIGYISFEKDQLEAKALDILKELIGFGIVRVST